MVLACPSPLGHGFCMFVAPEGPWGARLQSFLRGEETGGSGLQAAFAGLVQLIMRGDGGGPGLSPDQE